MTVYPGRQAGGGADSRALSRDLLPPKTHYKEQSHKVPAAPWRKAGDGGVCQAQRPQGGKSSELSIMTSTEVICLLGFSSPRRFHGDAGSVETDDLSCSKLPPWHCTHRKCRVNMAGVLSWGCKMLCLPGYRTDES